MPLPAPPWERLRERLLVCAGELAAAGDPSTAGALRATVDAWWAEQRRWDDEAVGLFSLQREINNTRAMSRLRLRLQRALDADAA